MLPIDISHGPLMYQHGLSIKLAGVHASVNTPFGKGRLVIRLGFGGGTHLQFMQPGIRSLTQTPAHPDKIEASSHMPLLFHDILLVLDIPKSHGAKNGILDSPMLGYVRVNGIEKDMPSLNTQLHIDQIRVDFSLGTCASSLCMGEQDFSMDLSLASKGFHMQLGRDSMHAIPMDFSLRTLAFNQLHLDSIMRWESISTATQSQSMKLIADLFNPQTEIQVNDMALKFGDSYPAAKGALVANLSIALDYLPKEHDLFDVILLGMYEYTLQADGLKYGMVEKTPSLDIANAKETAPTFSLDKFLLKGSHHKPILAASQMSFELSQLQSEKLNVSKFTFHYTAKPSDSDTGSLESGMAFNDLCALDHGNKVFCVHDLQTKSEMQPVNNLYAKPFYQTLKSNYKYMFDVSHSPDSRDQVMKHILHDNKLLFRDDTKGVTNGTANTSYGHVAWQWQSFPKKHMQPVPSKASQATVGGGQRHPMVGPATPYLQTLSAVLPGYVQGSVQVTDVKDPQLMLMLDGLVKNGYVVKHQEKGHYTMNFSMDPKQKRLTLNKQSFDHLLKPPAPIAPGQSTKTPSHKSPRLQP